MTRRKSNAKKPAAAKQKTGVENQQAAGLEQEAPALVAGDGVAGPVGTEHQGQAAGTDGGSDGSRLGDADVPFGTATAAAPVSGAGVLDQVNGGNGAGGVSGGEALDPDGNPAGDEAAPVVESRWHELYHNDPNFWPAIMAVEPVTAQALRIVDADPEKQLSEIALHHDALTGQCFAIAADLLREIGHVRATVDVVASQLVIKGQRAEKTLTGVERVAIECFLFALASLDGFSKAEADRLAREKAEAERKDAPPVPIDETTLETVDGPMDTWRV
jgi:hypothetical protein